MWVSLDSSQRAEGKCLTAFTEYQPTRDIYNSLTSLEAASWESLSGTQGSGGDLRRSPLSPSEPHLPCDFYRGVRAGSHPALRLVLLQFPIPRAGPRGWPAPAQRCPHSIASLVGNADSRGLRTHPVGVCGVSECTWRCDSPSWVPGVTPVRTQ